MTKLLAQVKAKDLKAFELAKEHVFGIAEGILSREEVQRYFDPPRGYREPRTLNDVFRQLVQSAQNRNMMASVVGGSIGGVEKLAPVLFGFSPQATLENHPDEEVLLARIKDEVRPRGEFRTGPGTLWRVFAKAILSGARFLSQFDEISDFRTWVATFDQDRRRRAALPLLISVEIEGFGFPLACDFLKELGFLNFPKPDVHVKAIMTGLDLSPGGAGDYAIFNAVSRIAENNEATPYAVDKAFWLVGSGKFHDHPAIGKDGRVKTDRDEFIRLTRAQLG